MLEGEPNVNIPLRGNRKDLLLQISQIEPPVVLILNVFIKDIKIFKYILKKLFTIKMHYLSWLSITTRISTKKGTF